MTPDTSDDRLLTPKEVARLMQIPLSALKRLRQRGEGPPVVVVSARTYRYRRADVEAWIEKWRAPG